MTRGDERLRLNFRLRGLLLSGALGGGMLASTGTGATPPTPPYTIEVVDRAVAAKLAADGSLELSLVVRPHASATSVVVQVYLQPVLPNQPTFAQPKAALIQELPMRRGRRERTLRVRLPALKPGEYVIDVRISGGIGEDEGFTSKTTRHLLIGPQGEVRLLRAPDYEKAKEASRWQAFREDLAKHPQHPRMRLLIDDTAPLPYQFEVKPQAVDAEQQLLVRSAGVSADLKGYYVEREAQSWEPQDPLTVRGRVVFMDVDGVVRPLVNVSVHVWDEDTFGGDEHLGGVASGWDGRWTLSVNNDDGALQDGRDIYYTFQLFNTRLDLSRCSGAYRWKSAVHEDQSDGTVVDFGDETAGTNTNALVVWDRLNLSWNHASTTGGQDPGLVSACFPAASTDYSTTVNVTAGDFDGDGVAHEYGHALMDHAYSEDISPGGAHGFNDCNQNQGLSWSEGWATAFMLSAFPDGRYNWSFGDTGRNIEKFSSDCRLGETSEGWAAAAILDFLDSADDGNGGFADRGRDIHADQNAGNRVSLATIFRDTMWGSVHFDVLDLWYDLAASLNNAPRAGAAEIMYYDWMSVLPPDSCVATKAVTAREADAEAVLADLRRFRDLALKPLGRGRELINAYYRNSPEMAALLLNDPAATADALIVIRHFARLGATIGTHRKYLEAMAADEPAIPVEVRAATERLLAFFTRHGGATLQRDVQQASAVYAELKDLRLPELQQHLVALKARQAEQPRVRLAPGKFSPESQRALELPAIRELRAKGLPEAPDARR